MRSLWGGLWGQLPWCFPPFPPYAPACAQPAVGARRGGPHPSLQQTGLCVLSTNTPLLSEGTGKRGSDPEPPAVCGLSVSERETSACSVSLLKPATDQAAQQLGFISPSLTSATGCFSCVTGLHKEPPFAVFPLPFTAHNFYQAWCSLQRLPSSATKK